MKLLFDVSMLNLRITVNGKLAVVLEVETVFR